MGAASLQYWNREDCDIKTRLFYNTWQDSYRPSKWHCIQVEQPTVLCLVMIKNIFQKAFFNTVDKLTINHNCAKPCVRIRLSSDYFMVYFLHKVVSHSHEIHHSLSFILPHRRKAWKYQRYYLPPEFSALDSLNWTVSSPLLCKVNNWSAGPTPN